MEKIRNIAIALIGHGGKYLVIEGYDSVKQKKFYRPLGGGIEFGEDSRDALKRELKEELNAEIKNAKLLNVIENIFDYEGQPGHEVVFVYQADFADSRFYEIEKFKRLDSKRDFDVIWKDLGGLTDENFKPEGILNLIERKGISIFP